MPAPPEIREPQLRSLTCRHSQADTSLLAGYHGDGQQPVHLTDRDRAVHTYIVGVSGTGKSRFIQSLLFQSISRGIPFCLLEPMGELYQRVKEYVAACLEQAMQRGFAGPELLERYLFLDAADPSNAVRINPLEPHPDESSEQAIDDLMKTIERVLGSLESQRRIRNVLRNSFLATIELNRLHPEVRTSLLGDRTFPLNLFFIAEFLNMADDERLRLLAALPDSPRLRSMRQFWTFYARAGQAAKSQIIQSTFNVLPFFLEDNLMLHVLDTHRSTIHIPDLLREGKSLICHLPIGGSLNGASFLGRLLATKFTQAAYRRSESERQKRYGLVIDEFHLFSDEAFAEALATVRSFGLNITLAHQSLSQFDKNDRGILETIKSNSRVKIVFRLGRADAEVLTRELFELTLKRKNFDVVDHSESRSQQRTSGESHSSGTSSGSGQNWSDARSRSTSQRESGSASETTTDGSRHGSGRSTKHETSTGTQHSESKSEGTSETTTTRSVYHTLEGERELMVASIQRLENRRCYVFTGIGRPQLIQTPYVPDELYTYHAVNFPQQLLEWQRSRLQRSSETSEFSSGQEKPSGQVVSFPQVKAFSPPEPAPDAVKEEESLPKTAGMGSNYPFVD